MKLYDNLLTAVYWYPYSRSSSRAGQKFSRNFLVLAGVFCQPATGKLDRAGENDWASCLHLHAWLPLIAGARQNTGKPLLLTQRPYLVGSFFLESEQARKQAINPRLFSGCLVFGLVVAATRRRVLNVFVRFSRLGSHACAGRGETRR